MQKFTPAVFTANAILYILWMLFFNGTLEKRFRSWLTLALQAAMFFTWCLVVSLTSYATPLRSLLSTGLFLACALALYRGPWPRRLLAGGITQMIMEFCELIVLVLYPELRYLTYGPDELPVATLLPLYAAYLLLNILLLWLSSLIFNRCRHRLSSREWMLYTLFPISQYLIFIIWFLLDVRGVTTGLVALEAVALCICAAADIALFFAIRGMAQRAELRAENALLEAQIDAQKNYYAALTDQYENIRRMRHDIANHLHTVHVLLENGQTDEAAAYAAEIQTGSRFRSSLGQCRQPVADSFLFSRAEELRRQGIDVRTDVVLPAELPSPAPI